MSLPLAMLSDWHIIVLAFLVVLIFGGKKLPEVARGLGEAMREFKKASRDLHEVRRRRPSRQRRPPPNQPLRRRSTPPNPSKAKAFSSASVVFEEESVGRGSGD